MPTRDKITRAWQLYELGRNYNNSLTPNQYKVCDTNWEFFIGNQWINLPNTPAMRGLPKPVFNILKRVASLFIASLASSATAMRFEPLAYYDGYGIADPQHDASEFANAAAETLLEKLKFDYRLRDCLFDGAVTGDYCMHFWFDPDARPFGSGYGSPYRGEIQMEMVDGINVLFGNPNDRRVQEQPYIIITGRDTVDNLRREARQRERIVPDADNEDFIGVGGKTELEEDEEGSGKALYCYLYEKEPGGTVRVTKATKTAVIYENVDTGLSVYPIAWGNWEKQKNQYHGRALVTGLIPNQIFINSMFAAAMRHLQLCAFPKTIFNADLISRWDNEIGRAIGVHGIRQGISTTDAAYNLQPAEMSGQIFALIDKVMEYTKDCLGATDAQLGNVKPENTSALMVLQTNAEVPLENIRAGLYEFVEDCGHIMLDMMGTYYGQRQIVVERDFEEPVTGPGDLPMIDPMTGMMATQMVTRKVMDVFDFSQLKNLWLNLRVDVGATTYFSEIAMTQTLDNLRREGILDVVEYLERLPDKLIPKKAELVEKMREQMAQPQQQASAGNSAAPAQGGPLDEALAVQSLPNSVSGRYNQLPGVAQRTARQLGEIRAGAAS